MHSNDHKIASPYRRYNAWNQYDRVFSTEPSLLQLHPHLKFSSVIVEFPNLRNTAPETSPFSLQAREVKVGQLRKIYVVFVHENCHLSMDILDILWFDKGKSEQNADCGDVFSFNDAFARDSEGWQTHK